MWKNVFIFAKKFKIELADKIMKKIVTTNENIEKLSKIFGVSTRSVYKALRYDTSGDRPNKIRTAALNMGATKLTSESSSN